MKTFAHIILANDIPAKRLTDEYYANRITGVSVRLFYNESHPNEVHLVWIERKYDAEKGLGKKAMDLLCKLADKYKVELVLDVSPHGKKFLLEYYKQFGFKRSGKTVWMYRKPKK